MNIKNMLKPVACATMLHAAGVIYAACYWQTTKNCAVTNNLVRQEGNPNGTCNDYWYATETWVSDDAPESSPGQDTYGDVNSFWCSGMARKFDCAIGDFVGSPAMTEANVDPYSYLSVITSVPCS